MKKFKKLLLALCCFTLLFTSCFCLTACNVTEDSKNIVNSTTEILPFEYSKAAATNILMSAYTNSLNQNFYKSVFSGEGFLNGIKQEGAPKYESYYFTKDGKTALAYCDISKTDAHPHFVTTINNVGYDFDMTAKTYSTNTNPSLAYTLVAQKSACSTVISGKYYQGADHVYGYLEGSSTYFEWVIKDNLIVEINQFISHAEFTYSFVNQTFEYGITDIKESDFPQIPTSLEGFTEQ